MREWQLGLSHISIIYSALGLPVPDHLPKHPRLPSRAAHLSRLPAAPTVPRSIILEAEVVPYNEGNRDGNRGPGVEEFWWLGVAGVTADSTRWDLSTFDLLPSCHRHLCLYFFDMLHLNGENLLDTPLHRRRELLEENIRVIPGFVSDHPHARSCQSELAEYTVIPLDEKRLALEALGAAFAQSNNRKEGVPAAGR